MKMHSPKHPRHSRATIEGLEGRLLCKLARNGEFLIDPPGGGQGHSAIHLHPDEGVIGIGSGGAYALAAAKALVRHTDLDARAIAEHAMNVAASICIYTNSNLAIEEL